MKKETVKSIKELFEKLLSNYRVESEMNIYERGDPEIDIPELDQEIKNYREQLESLLK